MILWVFTMGNVAGTTMLACMILICVMILGACPKKQTPTAIESSTCTHRQDRPELGSPLHSKSGGTGAPRERLKNGTKVKIVRTKGDWHLVRIAGSGRSGWLKSKYLGKCSAGGSIQKAKRSRKRGSAKKTAGKSQKARKQPHNQRQRARPWNPY